MDYEYIKDKPLLEQLEILTKHLIKKGLNEDEILDLLVEMTRKKAKLENKVGNQAEHINKHLICLALYPEQQERNHWISEIKAAIENFSIYRFKNKYLKAKQYYSELFEDIEEDSILLNSLIKLVKQKENKLIARDVKIHSLFNSMKYFYKDLSEYLTKGQATDRNIDRIINKHFPMEGIK